MGKRAQAYLLALSATMTLVACNRAQSPPPPSALPEAKQAAGPRPSELARMHPPGPVPPLQRGADVSLFLDWAGAAQDDQRDQVRRLAAGASDKPEILEALILELNRVQRSDHSRALLALAVLGQMRSPDAVRYLATFANRPLITGGPMVDGQDLGQLQQVKLQSKAVDGLAYANTPESNDVVKKIIARHPSRIVRAEAIDAYLWNHGDSAEAKLELAPFVKPDEAIFLDRVRRNSGETADTFNPKVAAFIKQHPDASAPKLEHSGPPAPYTPDPPSLPPPPL